MGQAAEPQGAGPPLAHLPYLLVDLRVSNWWALKMTQLVKFGCFVKAARFEKISCLLSNDKTNGIFFQIFVTLSENLAFIFFSTFKNSFYFGYLLIERLSIKIGNMYNNFLNI